MVPDTTSSPDTTPAPDTVTMPETTAAPDTTAPSETTPEKETTSPPPLTAPAPETTSPPVTTGSPADTEAPFFLYFTYTVKLDRGKPFDLHRYISYIDDRDSDVELIVDGEVDTAKVGEYKLKLTLKDDAGNRSSANMTVRVSEPLPPATSQTTGPVTPTPARSFADFAATYKNDSTMVGIDVSKWQGEIDFEKVAEAGCEFVIIRIGGYSDGVFFDPYYAANIRNARDAGLKIGVYWYSEENSPAKVRENAAYLYDLLAGEQLDFPIFFDWEDFVNFEDYKMSRRDLNDLFLVFREEAESRGYKAALYNSKYYLGLLWSEEVKGDGVWLAQYTDVPSYTGSFFLWQQGVARIDGIDTDVDVNVYYPSPNH